MLHAAVLQVAVPKSGSVSVPSAARVNPGLWATSHTSPHYSDRRTTAVGSGRQRGRAGTAIRFTASTTPGIVARIAMNGHCGRGRDAEAVGDEAPRDAARDQPERDPEHEADRREGRCLPRDRVPDLAAVEAERLEQRELAPSAAHRGDERVADGDERESAEQDRERHREPVDLVDPVDLDGERRRHGRVELGDRGDAAFDGGAVRAGREASRADSGSSSPGRRVERSPRS